MTLLNSSNKAPVYFTEEPHLKLTNGCREWKAKPGHKLSWPSQQYTTPWYRRWDRECFKRNQPIHQSFTIRYLWLNHNFNKIFLLSQTLRYINSNKILSGLICKNDGFEWYWNYWRYVLNTDNNRFCAFENSCAWFSNKGPIWLQPSGVILLSREHISAYGNGFVIPPAHKHSALPYNIHFAVSCHLWYFLDSEFPKLVLNQIF